MSDIGALARRQMRLSYLTKKLDERKKQLRKQFFSYADHNVPEYMLPTISIRVPVSFFETTGYTHSYFLETRFPSWQLQAMTENEDGYFVFVLRKRPEYMQFNEAEDSLQISRSVSEITPEIDWDSMRKADPELFKMFAKPVTVYELDTEVFQKTMANDPQFDAQGFLARHSKHKPPTLRVLAKEIKSEE